jgi:hypothetical protein
MHAGCQVISCSLTTLSLIVLFILKNKKQPAKLKNKISGQVIVGGGIEETVRK